MGENTKIEWADHTFNPWMGCTKVSEGCRNCYAENQMDHRWNKVQWGPGKPRVRTSEAMWRKPLQWNAEAEKTGIRPRVFSLSLGDWLDPEVPIEWLADFLALIQKTPHLNWLLVTKRPELWPRRMAHVFGFEMCENHNAERGRIQLAWDWFHGNEAPANVWILASVENQAATSRINELVDIPARVHGLSCEPMCGALDLYLSGIDWVICGGESGQNARPMSPDWVRNLRDQCTRNNVPFFLKQWGEWLSEEEALLKVGDDFQLSKMKTTVQHNEIFYWFGKKDAGRVLDGREWNEVPEVTHD